MLTDEKKFKEHLKTHMEYPASKEELMEACGEMSDVEDADKKMLMEKLPEGSYSSAEEVMVALGI